MWVRAGVKVRVRARSGPVFRLGAARRLLARAVARYLVRLRVRVRVRIRFMLRLRLRLRLRARAWARARAVARYLWPLITILSPGRREGRASRMDCGASITAVSSEPVRLQLASGSGLGLG